MDIKEAQDFENFLMQEFTAPEAGSESIANAPASGDSTATAPSRAGASTQGLQPLLGDDSPTTPERTPFDDQREFLEGKESQPEAQAQVEATQPEQPKDKPSDRFRKVQLASEREANARAQRDELARLRQIAQEHESIKQQIKDKPFEVIARLGLPKDQLTQAYINSADEKDTPKSELEVRELKSELNLIKTQMQAEKQQAWEATVKSEVAKYKAGIQGAASTLDHLNAAGEEGLELAYEIASKHFDQTLTALDPKVAAEYANEYFADLEQKLSKARAKTDSKQAKVPAIEQKPKASPVTLTATSNHSVQKQADRKPDRFAEVDEQIAWLESISNG